VLTKESRTRVTQGNTNTCDIRNHENVLHKKPWTRVT